MPTFDTYKEGDKLIPWNILGSFKGAELEGCRYEQLLPYEANSAGSFRRRSIQGPGG